MSTTKSIDTDSDEEKFLNDIADELIDFYAKQKPKEKPKPKRIPFIVGNWKCNVTIKKLISSIKGINKIDTSNIETVIAPTSLHLPIALSKIKSFHICSQNVSATSLGAYTGEIAAKQLKELNIKYTIVGHTERKLYQKETNDIINKKINIAIKNDLKVITYIGETYKDRKHRRTMRILGHQLNTIFNAIDISNNEDRNIVIAYEPVWTITKGKRCDPDMAQDTMHNIREYIKKKFSKTVSENIRILYGGSVKPNNCIQYIKKKDIDGFVIGSASLNPDSFGQIIKSVQEYGLN